MRFSPHFQLFYFNDRLEFCEFFEWKIKRINNADLFSQPPLLIFIKGANISGGHCMAKLNENIWFLGYFMILLGCFGILIRKQDEIQIKNINFAVYKWTLVSKYVQ